MNLALALYRNCKRSSLKGKWDVVCVFELMFFLFSFSTTMMVDYNIFSGKIQQTFSTNLGNCSKFLAKERGTLKCTITLLFALDNYYTVQWCENRGKVFSNDFCH